ncbi:MAG: RDD family protein [Cellulomonas sp.]|uniref:RDD family protein n=1 Tax=Cellulomonas sp. TaxID=40001 RepID=UPI0019DC180F|nr:RDD family protein [Cellulomonas sp.]MBF0686435.1 RDD family protein [Cellulomonas sp.]
MPLAPDAESCAVCGARVPLIARPAADDDDATVADTPPAGDPGARWASGGAAVPRAQVVEPTVPTGSGTGSGTVSRSRPPLSHRAPGPTAGSTERPAPVPAASFDAAAAARDVRGSARATRSGGSRVADVPPSVGTRVLAYAIDLVAAAAAAGVGLLVAGSDGGLPVLPGLLALLVAVAQIVAEGVGGATLGARLLGLRTVDDRTGRPPGVGRAFVRQLVVGVGTLACLVGNWAVAASAAWDSGPRRRGWHDKASGTTVVHASAQPPESRRPAGAATSGEQRPQGAARPWTPSVPPGAPAPEAPAPAAAVVDDFLLAPAPPTSSVAPAPAPAAPPPAPDLLPAAPAGSAPLPAAEQAESDLLPPPPQARRQTDGVRPGPAPAAAHPLDDDLAELEHTRVRDPESLRRRTGTLALHFDTGERVRVVGRGLVGRGPRAEDGEDILHVIVLNDAARSLSRVHAEFGPQGATAEEDSAIWVADRGSTNGTVVIDPAGTARVLPAGTRALVGAGWTVRLGDREARVESD